MHKISNNERINHCEKVERIEQENSVLSVILYIKSCGSAIISINQRRLTNKHTCSVAINFINNIRKYQEMYNNSALFFSMHDYVTLIQSLLVLELSILLVVSVHAFTCQSFLINISIIIEDHKTMQDFSFQFSLFYLIADVSRFVTEFYIYNFSLSLSLSFSLPLCLRLFRKRNVESCFSNIK